MARDIKQLEKKAKDIRRDILEMIYQAKSGHLGGSFSEVEMMIALYYDEMSFDPAQPHYPDRDRLILSKGHTAPALYAVLADLQFFPKEALFHSFRKTDGILQGHPDMKKTPGIDMTTGSLGIGLSAAVGMALGYKYQKKEGRIYCILGDGEINEGQIWEAAATAAHYGLDNILAIVDLNGLQNDASTLCVKDMKNVAKKWEAFGWNVVEIDGHKFTEIFEAFDWARRQKGKPSVILAHTIKGKGVSFMEGKVEFHGKVPNKEEYEKALAELE